MAKLKLRLGFTQGSLTLFDPASSGISSYSIDRQNRTKKRISWSGSRNYSILGQNKKVHALEYQYLNKSQRAYLESNANTSRKYYARITDDGANLLYEGFCFVQTSDTEILYVTDTDTFFKLKLLLFEA